LIKEIFADMDNHGYPLQCSAVNFLTHMSNTIKFFIPIRDETTFFINKFEVYFKKSQFVVNKRSERFGFIDFISNCGGLMGLFMGISLLSIAEIFYFFVVFLWKLFCKFYYRNNRVYDFRNWFFEKQLLASFSTTTRHTS
jgi:hypothetical protein